MDKLRENTEILTKAQKENYAQASAIEATDTLSGAYKEMKSAIEGAVLTMDTTLTPALTGVTDQITEMVRGLDREKIQDFGKALGTLAKGAVAVGSALGTTIGFVTEFMEDNTALATVLAGSTLAFAKFGLTANTLTGSVSEFMGKTGKLTTKLKGLKKVLSAITGSPYGILLAGIATAAVLVYDKVSSTNEALLKSNQTQLDSATAVMEQMKRNVVVYDETSKAYKTTHENRDKLLKQNDKLINQIGLEISAGKQRNETDFTWIKRRKALEHQTELLTTQIGMLNNAQITNLETTAKEKEAIEHKKKLLEDEAKAREEVIKQTIEHNKELDKLAQTYEKAIEKSNKAIASLEDKETSLTQNLADMYKERRNIVSTYADKRLELETALQDKIAELQGDTKEDRWKVELNNYRKYSDLILSG